MSRFSERAFRRHIAGDRRGSVRGLGARPDGAREGRSVRPDQNCRKQQATEDDHCWHRIKAKAEHCGGSPRPSGSGVPLDSGLGVAYYTCVYRTGLTRPRCILVPLFLRTFTQVFGFVWLPGPDGPTRASITFTLITKCDIDFPK
jgi:hypothetical protein